jgi:competence protein ComEC
LLRARGERRVDLLMLSHRDADHVGGAAALLAGLPVRQLSTSLADEHPLLAGGAPHRRCAAGQPGPGTGCSSRSCTRWPVTTRPLKPNALSCVLRVQGVAGGRPLRLLLTGDIEAAQEAALLARTGAALRRPTCCWCRTMAAAPRPARRSSKPCGPRVALVQAGYRSRFGHPAPSVLARYRQRRCHRVRSDACGAWQLPPHGACRVRAPARRRYWHHPGLAAAP